MSFVNHGFVKQSKNVINGIVILSLFMGIFGSNESKKDQKIWKNLTPWSYPGTEAIYMNEAVMTTTVIQIFIAHRCY